VTYQLILIGSLLCMVSYRSVYVVWYRLVEVWCQLFSLVTAVRWYGAMVSVFDGTAYVFQCGVSLRYVFSFVYQFRYGMLCRSVASSFLRSSASCVITECCFGVRYRGLNVLHSECHFVMYSFGAVLCGSFRSVAS